MDSRDIYRDGPCLADTMPDWPLGEYRKRFGTGRMGLACIIAIASHETSTGDPWVRISAVSHFLGANIHPSIALLVDKLWAEKRVVEATKYAPRIGLPGRVYYTRLTPLGWEYVTEFLGVNRSAHVENHQGRACNT